MPKIMILNGPQGCNAGTAAKAIENFFEGVCKKLYFSQPLKDMSASVMVYPQDILEQEKDNVLPGMEYSYSDAQVYVYNALSPIFGNDFLGKAMIKQIELCEEPYVIIPDGGRMADVLPLLKIYDPTEMMIVQIMKEGCSFHSDIRSYISAPNIRTRPIINKDDVSFVSEMIYFASDFFAN